MPKGRRPRGVTPCPRSGAVTKSARLRWTGTAESYPASEVRVSGQEELPHVRGQGQKPGGPQARRAAAKRSYPMSEVRGSGREDQTHVQGAVARGCRRA